MQVLCPINYKGTVISIRYRATSSTQVHTQGFYFKYLITINLTKTFGAGNEPTKEEMALLISTLGIDYFEGEITIPAQKVNAMAVGDNRQNKRNYSFRII